MAERTEVRKSFFGQYQASTHLTPELIAQMYYVYTPKILKLAKKYARDDSSIEDLRQEGYIALIEALRTYDHTLSSFSTYLHRKINTYMLNWCRKEKTFALSGPFSSYKYVSLDDPIGHDNSDGSIDSFNYNDTIQDVGRDISPEDCLFSSDLGKSVKSGLSLLTENQKEAVHYLFWDEYSPSEIADEMGISRPRVTAIIKSALSNVRKHFQCAA